MTLKTTVKLPSLVVLSVFLAIPLLLTWRARLFFVIDDWSALLHLANYPLWRYLVQTDAEQWFPFFHLCYYLLIQLSGENYQILVTANCLGTGVNAFLVYLFLRRHLGQGPGFILGLIYCAAVVHGAVIWHAYNLCYLLAFGFFMGALLLADDYLAHPTGGRLAGLGVCALLAILSHSFAIMSLAVILLYAFLLGEDKTARWRVGLVLGLVYLIFAAGYVTFAGVTPASSQNRQILSQLPGLSYVRYLFYGGFFFPFYFLLGGTIMAHKLLYAPILGGVGLMVLLPLIFLKGEFRTKRMALWVLLANVTFFLLVGLARHQMTISQAGSLRYGVFTLLGALLLGGLAWQTLKRLWQPQWARRLGCLLAGVVLAVQVGASLHLKKDYEREGEMVRIAYQSLEKEATGATVREAGGARELFCPLTHPWLTRGQALTIRRYLRAEQSER